LPGIEHEDPGVRAQPKFVTGAGDRPAGPGVSMAPNGLVACALSTVIVFEPRSEGRDDRKSRANALQLVDAVSLFGSP